MSLKRAAVEIEGNKARAKQQRSDSSDEEEYGDEESGGGMRVDFGLGTESPSAWSLDVDEMHDLMTVRGSVRFQSVILSLR